MTRLSIPASLALLTALILVGCEAHAPRATQEEPASVTLPASSPESNVLIVAHDRDYPPYEYVTSDGKSAGKSIDMITEVAHQINREVRFHPLTWVEVLQELSTGKADVTPTMLYSPERGRKWALSVSWGLATSVVYVRGTSKIRTIRDVIPRVLAAPMGDIEYEALKQKGVSRLIATQDTEEALSMTIIGKADGAGVNREVAQTLFKRHVGWETDLHELEPPLAVTPIMVASRKGNERLLFHISQVILKMKKNGSL